jgi:hypothetical protein
MMTTVQDAVPAPHGAKWMTLGRGRRRSKKRELQEMPEITVNMAAGRTDEQKAGMMRDITQALAKNLGSTPTPS